MGKPKENTEAYKRWKEGSRKSGELAKERAKKIKQDYENDPKICPTCNMVIPYEKRANKYCSRSCSAIVNNKNIVRNGSKREKNNCLNCNKITKNKKYCSHICQQDYRKKQQWNQILASGKLDGIITDKTYRLMLIEKTNNTCSICGTTKWLGQPVGLILDHIDGDSNNNSLKNLRLVCGNCDMQLPTYKSKNIGNGRHNRRKRYQTGKSY